MLRSIIVIEHPHLTDKLAVARLVRGMLRNPTANNIHVEVSITDRIEGTDNHVLDDRFILRCMDDVVMEAALQAHPEALGAEVDSMSDRLVPRYPLDLHDTIAVMETPIPAKPDPGAGMWLSHANRMVEKIGGIEQRAAVEAGASMSMMSLGSTDTVTLTGMPEGSSIQNGTYPIEAVDGDKTVGVTITVGGMTAPAPSPGDNHGPDYVRYPNELGVPEGYCIIFIPEHKKWSYTRPDGEIHHTLFGTKSRAIEEAKFDPDFRVEEEDVEDAPKFYTTPQAIEGLIKEKLEEALDGALADFPHWRNKFHPLMASKGRAAVSELVALIFGVRSELGNAASKNITN